MAKKPIGQARYAIYVRCSSDDQKHKDFSTTDVQESLNRNYVQAKGGIVACLYKDEAVSGTTLNRKGYMQLLADAQAKKFNAVIVTYMSRLGRGRSFVIAEYELEKCGVKVEMVKEQFTDDIGGYMGKNMTNVMDGMYAFQVRQWTMTKMEAMVAAGYFPGGYPPFGMLKVIATDGAGFHRAGSEPPKRLAPDPAAADIVRQAFALFLETGQQAKVREYLNAVTTRSWTTTAVKRLLTNEVYKGDIVFGQWRNAGAYEAVVAAEAWEAVQAALGSQAGRGARTETADDFTYYLRGRVQCPHCNCPYTQGSHHGKTKRVHYYECRCMNRREKCPVGRVNADRVHHTILNYMDYASRHPTVMHKLIAQSGGWTTADDSQKALRGQLGKQKQMLEVQIGNYVKALGDGKMSNAILAALEKAEANREEVLRQMEVADHDIALATIKRPTAAQVSEAWGNIKRVWKVLDEEDRADLLGSFVQAVEVTEKEELILELLPVSISSPLIYSEEFKLNSHLGAGKSRSLNRLLSTRSFGRQRPCLLVSSVHSQLYADQKRRNAYSSRCGVRVFSGNGIR